MTTVNSIGKDFEFTDAEIDEMLPVHHHDPFDRLLIAQAHRRQAHHRH